MSEMDGSSYYNTTQKRDDMSSAAGNTVSLIGQLSFTSSNLSISKNNSNNCGLSSSSSQSTFLIENILSLQVIWKNYYYRLYFDFDKTINELHYYLHDQYFFPIVGDFYCEHYYLLPMCSLRQNGIKEGSVLHLSTDHYDTYIKRQSSEIFPILYDRSYIQLLRSKEASVKGMTKKKIENQKKEDKDDDISSLTGSTISTKDDIIDNKSYSTTVASNKEDGKSKNSIKRGKFLCFVLSWFFKVFVSFSLFVGRTDTPANQEKEGKKIKMEEDKHDSCNKPTEIANSGSPDTSVDSISQAAIKEKKVVRILTDKGYQLDDSLYAVQACQSYDVDTIVAFISETNQKSETIMKEKNSLNHNEIIDLVSISSASSPDPSTASSIKSVEIVNILTDLKKPRVEFISKK
jgi:hypothetical protein